MKNMSAYPMHHQYKINFDPSGEEALLNFFQHLNHRPLITELIIDEQLFNKKVNNEEDKKKFFQKLQFLLRLEAAQTIVQINGKTCDTNKKNEKIEKIGEKNVNLAENIEWILNDNYQKAFEETAPVLPIEINLLSRDFEKLTQYLLTLAQTRKIALKLVLPEHCDERELNDAKDNLGKLFTKLLEASQKSEEKLQELHIIKLDIDQQLDLTSYELDRLKTIQKIPSLRYLDYACKNEEKPEIKILFNTETENVIHLSVRPNWEIFDINKSDKQEQINKFVQDFQELDLKEGQNTVTSLTIDAMNKPSFFSASIKDLLYCGKDKPRTKLEHLCIRYSPYYREGCDGLLEKEFNQLIKTIEANEKTLQSFIFNARLSPSQFSKLCAHLTFCTSLKKLDFSGVTIVEKKYLVQDQRNSYENDIIDGIQKIFGEVKKEKFEPYSIGTVKEQNLKPGETGAPQLTEVVLPFAVKEIHTENMLNIIGTALALRENLEKNKTPIKKLVFSPNIKIGPDINGNFSTYVKTKAKSLEELHLNCDREISHAYYYNRFESMGNINQINLYQIENKGKISSEVNSKIEALGETFGSMLDACNKSKPVNSELSNQAIYNELHAQFLQESSKTQPNLARLEEIEGNVMFFNRKLDKPSDKKGQVSSCILPNVEKTNWFFDSIQRSAQRRQRNFVGDWQELWTRSFEKQLKSKQDPNVSHLSSQKEELKKKLNPYLDSNLLERIYKGNKLTPEKKRGAIHMLKITEAINMRVLEYFEIYCDRRRDISENKSKFFRGGTKIYHGDSGYIRALETVERFLSCIKKGMFTILVNALHQDKDTSEKQFKCFWQQILGVLKGVISIHKEKSWFTSKNSFTRHLESLCNEIVAKSEIDAEILLNIQPEETGFFSDNIIDAIVKAKRIDKYDASDIRDIHAATLSRG